MGNAAVAPMRICGFCSDKNHEYCPHAIKNGDRGLWFCNCAEPNCGGKILSCIDCRLVHDDVTPDTRQCVDRDACNARRMKYRDEATSFVKLGIIKENAMAEQAEKKTAERVAEVREADCTCGCGGKTEGGKFPPGHDARYVSEQVGHVVGKNKTEAVARKEIVAVSEALGAKFDKSLSLHRERIAKSEAAAKAKADKKEADKKAKADAAAKAKAEKASATV